MECGRVCQGLAETGKVWHRLARCGRVWQGLVETGKVWHRLARCERVWQGVAKCGRVWQSVAKCGKVWQILAKSGTKENNRHICHKKYHGVQFTKSGIIDRLVRQSRHGYTPLVKVN